MPDPTADAAWVAAETRDPHILEQVYRLRVAAWRARNPDLPDMEAWTDAFDAVGRHWVVMDADVPVAAARLTVHSQMAEVPSAEIYRGLIADDLPGPIGALTRLVVAKSHAGRGLSLALDRVRIAAADASGCRHLIGETFAGLPRLDQMRSLGFDVIGTAGEYADGPLGPVKRGGRTSASDHQAGPRERQVYVLMLPQDWLTGRVFRPF
jgi:GNAT superfamily N-acetyltransferase